MQTSDTEGKTKGCGIRYGLVDSTKQKKQSRLGRPRGGQQNQGWRQHRNREERVKKRNEQANDRTNRRYKKLANARYTSRRRVGWNAEQTRFDASVNITSDWKVVEQLEMSEFDKLKVKAYPEARTWHGADMWKSTRRSLTASHQRSREAAKVR